MVATPVLSAFVLLLDGTTGVNALLMSPTILSTSSHSSSYYSSRRRTVFIYASSATSMTSRGGASSSSSSQLQQFGKTQIVWHPSTTTSSVRMSMNTNDIMPPNYYNDDPCIRNRRTPPPSTGGGEDEVTTRNRRSRIGQWTSKLVSRFSAAAMTATLRKGRDSVENIRTKMKRQFKFLRAGPILAAAFFFLLLSPPLLAWASGGGGSVKRDPNIPIIPLTTNELISKLSLWLGIFIALALLHAAEIAITTLYPWKVREFAEEEEKVLSNEGGKGSSHDGRSKNDKRSRKQRRGTFQTLNEDITRVLTTILVTSTACSIYATTLFTHLSDHIFGIEWASKWSAVFLTGITLFFVELLPKNIGVINAERVARLMVPPINVLANAVGPFGYALSYLAKSTLRLFGVQAKEETGVSDSELRLIVTGARDSGTIDHSEQEMIKGVLNLQDRKVREIMKPRVEVVAVPRTMSVASVLGVVRESGYSRIPVCKSSFCLYVCFVFSVIFFHHRLFTSTIIFNVTLMMLYLCVYNILLHCSF